MLSELIDGAECMGSGRAFTLWLCDVKPIKLFLPFIFFFNTVSQITFLSKIHLLLIASHCGQQLNKSQTEFYFMLLESRPAISLQTHKIVAQFSHIDTGIQHHTNCPEFRGLKHQGEKYKRKPTEPLCPFAGEPGGQRKETEEVERDN